jgi:predicted Zn-dependent protease
MLTGVLFNAGLAQLKEYQSNLLLNRIQQITSVGLAVGLSLQVYILSQRFANREQFLSQNLKVVPHSNLLHRLLAQELAAAKKLDQALELLERARMENPYDVQVQVQIAELKHVVERQKQNRLPAQNVGD